MKALVTRPPEDATPVAAALRARGIAAMTAPMLQIEPEPGAAVRLAGALAGVQAVLFTSANGVRAFAEASGRFELPAYCVGAASAAAARLAGFRTVASADGAVADLAALAAARLAPGNGPLLHAAGAVTAGDLAAELAAKGFGVRRIVLYRAVPTVHFAPETAAALRRGEIDLALFFSPRSAETFVRLVAGGGMAEPCRGMIAVCLGRNVAAALNGLAWRATAIAAAPNLAALMAALDGILAA
jgi:uroporphyrinogen-III synthase